MIVSVFIQEFSLLGIKSTNGKNLREILVREGMVVINDNSLTVTT